MCERERKRETDRQIDRRRGGGGERERDRQTVTETDRERQTERRTESESEIDKSTDDLSVWEYEINFGLPPPRVVRFHSVHPGVAGLTDEVPSKRRVSSRKHGLSRTEHLVTVTL